MKEVADLKRYSSPTVTPQALAWDGKQLWMSSRDLGTLYRTELDGLKIVEEIDPPGVVLTHSRMAREETRGRNGIARFVAGRGRRAQNSKLIRASWEDMTEM
jgi:hypothetical protein